MIWSTTSYTRTPDGLVEAHRDLGPDELPAAVYAVEASDNGGRSYSANGLRWADIDDAKTWASGLAMRWFGCTNIRVVRVTPPGWVYAGPGPAPAYVVEDVIYQTL